ncbi:unnamed protein product [Cuscuta campestris]|uniref:GAG-pre-integrase domain-containing protein n=1 Tax=Cuscuta campestris TaxID=132261 RepID=A0A484MYI6_9ASTE|nr:unnamed protein product [Cuscuta campestris]
MRAFLKSQGGRVWRIIETGWTEPTETNAEGVKIIKTFEKYSKEEAQAAECNDRAINALFGAVDSSQYRLISNCTEAKKAWEILETTHEGDERVKTAKIQILITKYESLRMDDKERIANFHGRVRELANEAENLKRPFTEDSLVLKVLRALPEAYAMDAKAIRQAHDIKNMTLDQLMGNLETIELQMNEELKRKKSDKPIAFHSLINEDENEDDKRQAFMTTWSDDDEETEDVTGNSNCAFVTQYEEEDVEDTTEQLIVLQEKWTELLLVHRRNILEKNQLAAHVDDLQKKLDNVKKQLNRTEGEKSDLQYELTQLKNYHKWMKSAGAEKIEEMVSTSRLYGDRSGIGHTASEGVKTPLDLFTKGARITIKEPDTKEGFESNPSKAKEKVVQPYNSHVRKTYSLNPYFNYFCFYCRKKGHIKRQSYKLRNLKRRKAVAIRHVKTIMKWVPKHRASCANFCYRVTPDQWLLDSGCSHHMTGDKQNLTNVQPIEGGNVRFGGGAHGQIIRNGTLHVAGLPPIKNVWLVQGLQVNLLSISQICDQARERDARLWHYKLGHMNYTDLKTFSSSGAVRGLPKITQADDQRIEPANMVRTKIALPQQWRKPQSTRRNAVVLKKFALARAKLQRSISIAESSCMSTPPNIGKRSQHSSTVAEILLAEQVDEAPLNPNLPAVLYLEYPTQEQANKESPTPQVMENTSEKNNLNRQEESGKTKSGEAGKPDNVEDEEFLNLLDEEPLMAVSEVPFHTQASTMNTPQNSKSKSKPSVSNPVRWSKRKLESEIRTLEASSSLSKRNIDVDDFTLKTNLMSLLKDRKLLKSVTLPGSYVKQVIHEFYCNLNENFAQPTDENFEQVFVRGKYYDFSPAAVNTFLGMTDELDVQIGEARNSQQSTNKVPSSILNSSYSILLCVVACHWLATTHTNTVTKAMGMLLYKIKNGVPINLGKLIVSQITEFGKRNYKQNDNGLPFPVLIFQMLLSQGFVKVAADKEEPPEPLLQIDYRHFEGNHFNDMQSTQSSAPQRVSAGIQYLDAKLEANREEMRMTLAKQSALEEEYKHLTWLREVVTASAAIKGESAQGESSQEKEHEDELSA